MVQKGQTNKLTIPPWDQASLGSPAQRMVQRLGNDVTVLQPVYAKLPKSQGLIGILVAEDTEMGTQLLVDSLRRNRNFQVTAASGDSVHTIVSTCDSKPHVALISSSLDRGTLKGLELSRGLRSIHPEIKVVILLDRSVPELVVEAFRAGAQGVFCRTGSLKALRKCILCVHEGQVWASNKEICYVLESLSEIRPRPLLDARGVRLLSKREEDVLNCAVDGLKNREIAAQLHLSEHTIKNYMFRIFDKLGVSSRVEMILYALSQRSSSSSTSPSYELVRNSSSVAGAKAS